MDDDSQYSIQTFTGLISKVLDSQLKGAEAEHLAERQYLEAQRAGSAVNLGTLVSQILNDDPAQATKDLLSEVDKIAKDSQKAVDLKQKEEDRQDDFQAQGYPAPVITT
jgi:hypothetical protein